jgi:hypothetical protein
MKKLLTTLAALTVFATPAFAQSFCTCDGTGNVLKFTNNPITYENRAPAIAATAPGGLHAFAMAPGRSGALLNADDPAATGGGSLGYNEMLRSNY